MELIITILSIVGAIASIIGLVPLLKNNGSKRETWMFGILILISISWGVTFYLYKKTTDSQLQLERRMDMVRKDAVKLLESAPTYISNYNPGDNEGLMLSTLVLLEKNKGLFPETYELYRHEVTMTMDIVNSQSDELKKRDQLELAGNAAVRILKSLSQ